MRILSLATSSSQTMMRWQFVAFDQTLRELAPVRGIEVPFAELEAATYTLARELASIPLSQLAAMKLKHLRFSHIDIHHIYTFDSKF